MQLRTCRTLEGLIAILRERRDELDLTNETLEAAAGISDRYATKILSLRPVRRLGPMSLDALLGALALKICTITIESDEVVAAVMAPKWKPRRGRPREQRRRMTREDAAAFPCAWDLIFFAPAPEPPPKPKPPAAASLVRCCRLQQTVFDFSNATEASDMKLIGARCDDELAEQVEAAAAKERRPVAAFVRNVLTDAVKPHDEAAAAPATKSADEVAA